MKSPKLELFATISLTSEFRFHIEHYLFPTIRLDGSRPVLGSNRNGPRGLETELRRKTRWE